MGNYITKTDIIEQLAEESLMQLTDDEGIGSVNDVRVDAAIEDSEGEVDGYLSVRYACPISPTPKIIKKCAVDIAIYNLYARRDTANEEREKRYKNAVRFLENASKGVVTLGADAPIREDSARVSIESADRLWTRKDLDNY
ncbi:MAG: DUF1320 domain-containing protein [Deltaproteobacteria bacterium]|nr:DUF1320 domain-containing protein [Deltaproteobacteria bacterium]